MQTEKYVISGMSCAACSASVTRVVQKLDGVKKCDVNLITGKMEVVFDPKKVSSADFIRVVEKAGFGIEKEQEKSIAQKKTEKEESFIPFIVTAVFTAVLLYVSMGPMLFKGLPLPSFLDMELQPYNYALTQLLLCLPALFLGKRFFTNGIPLLLKGHPNMDSLVAVGAGAALIYSIVTVYTIGYNPHSVHNLYFESVAVVITLVKLGKYFESRSRKKTGEQIKKLMELAPETAVLIEDEKEKTVATENVSIGQIVVVKAGTKFPLDGEIIQGFCMADESMLTGESLPIEKGVGDTVVAGSINLDGLVYFKVTKTVKDTAVAKIIKFVEEAQSKKAPISKTADKVAGIFVPFVFLIAIISFIVWILITRDIAFSLKIFTSVLVVACPCALGLATPTAIMVGTGLGAKNGILIKNGEVLETTHKTAVAVFDKTGTVTEGKMVVCDVFGDEKIIKLAAIAEKGSKHPIAKAIIEYAEENKISVKETAENFKNIAGKGVYCEFDSQQLLVGKKELLEENGIDLKNFEEKANQKAAEGKTIIYVAFNKEILGLIIVSDTLKSTSKIAFSELAKMNVKTALLTGDNKPCAEHIASELSSDMVFAEVLPTEKAEILKKLKKEYGNVLMVGDGINDAPALSEASVGMAIGNGSDIALESADIVLMKNDILDVVKAIKLSRYTIKNIKQNLFWAFLYNSICIPIAAGVLYPFTGLLLSPMLAGLAMSFSSVFVVGNALRLRGKKL